MRKLRSALIALAFVGTAFAMSACGGVAGCNEDADVVSTHLSAASQVLADDHDEFEECDD